MWCKACLLLAAHQCTRAPVQTTWHFHTYNVRKITSPVWSDEPWFSVYSYGFVTFETQEDAEKIIKKESENLVFKERKLNIGPAVRKQVNNCLQSGQLYSHAGAQHMYYFKLLFSKRSLAWVSLVLIGRYVDLFKWGHVGWVVCVWSNRASWLTLEVFSFTWQVWPPLIRKDLFFFLWLASFFWLSDSPSSSFTACYTTWHLSRFEAFLRVHSQF